MKIAVLSNVNLDLLIQNLSEDNSVYTQEGYGQWIQETIEPSQAFINFKPEFIFVLLDGAALLDGVSSAFSAEQELSMAIKHCEILAGHFTSVPIFVSAIDILSKKIIEGDRIRPEYQLMNFWDKQLDQCIKNNLNVHLFDLRNLICDFGRRNFYSDKMWYMGSIPYGIKAISVLADAIKFKIQCYSAIRKKVLVLDLDNTLWGGVLGEDGFDGIQISRSLLGAAYRAAQIRIKDMQDLGVLLAIASKNDESDVLHVLSEHPQMVLRPDDFVAIKANWNSKAENIANIADTLNLGLESFVFLDDNPVEQEAVRTALPGITVADFPKDISNLPSVIQKIADKYFVSARITKEDLLKTQQYHEERARQAALNNASSMEDYLVSLQIKVVLEEMKDIQIERVAQLTQKTNQFNLMTARYSTEQLMNYRKSRKNRIYVASVSDRYGDSGLVFILMISINGDSANIDNLLMSCRVMGRYIEDVVVNAAEKRLEQNGIKQITARYIPTAKNKPVENLMERLDYQQIGIEENNIKMYRRILGEACHRRKILFDVDWE